MSQQINLYDPALLRRRELLTATNLAAVAAVLLLAIGGWGAAVRAQLARLDRESQSVIPTLKALQDQVTSIGKQLAAIKPDPRLEAELASAQGLLAMRNEIVAALKKGVGSESPSFAEFLRGLARQAPSGLWLTGFLVGEGGATMEIRGRMLDPAVLPEYIHRLNGEKSFRGRAFAALKVGAGQPAATPGAPAPAGGQTAPAKPSASAAPPPYYEFTLVPTQAAAPAAADPKPGAPLADVLPSDAARALGDAKRPAQEAKR